MIALMAAVALAAANAAATDTATTTSGPPADVASLERFYTQSCGERAYATYDDVCNTLRNQIDRYRKDEAKRLRDERAHPKPAAKEAASSPTASAPPAADASAQKP